MPRRTIVLLLAVALLASSVSAQTSGSGYVRKASDSDQVEYRIFEQWSAAVFLDAGNAFNDFQGEVAFGTGFGARWISPVGLIRIDLGFGLNKEGNPLRLHLGIGPDFQ